MVEKVFLSSKNQYLSDFFSSNKRFEVTNRIRDASFVLFGGGADIDPVFYGEGRIPGCNVDKEKDKNEVRVFLEAQVEKKPCVGVCRGAQFLWVMSGGKLWQDVDNHKGVHTAYTTNLKGLVNKKSKKFTVSSTHHQMVKASSMDREWYPLMLSNIGHEFVSASPSTRIGVPLRTIQRKVTNKNEIFSLPILKDTMEVEAYHIPETDCFGVQWHPEYLDGRDPAVNWFWETLDTFLFTPTELKEG